MVRDTVSFGVAVRDIVFDEGFIIGADDFAKEGVQEGHCGCAVHVIVTIDKDFLVVHNRLGEAFHSLVHVLHQEGIVEFGNIRIEKIEGCFRSVNTSLEQQCGQRLLYRELRCKLLGYRIIGKFIAYPPFIHNITILRGRKYIQLSL